MGSGPGHETIYHLYVRQAWELTRALQACYTLAAQVSELVRENAELRAKLRTEEPQEAPPRCG